MLSRQSCWPHTSPHNQHGMVALGLRHVQVWCCLLALLLQLVLPAIHLWHGLEEELSFASIAWQGRSAAQGMPTQLSVAKHSAKTWQHDVLLCPLCQVLAHVYTSMVPPVAGGILQQAHSVLSPPVVHLPSVLFVTSFVPRAPPHFS